VNRVDGNFLEMDNEERYCTGDGPFTGEAYITYWDESLYFVQQYKDGFKNGPGRQFHPDGALALEGEWLYGRRVGVHRRWYEDGALRSELDYSGDGLPTGNTFNPDGTPDRRPTQL
jgi:antitoxin component YwqK of YwqJK toxin-antitoxin module